MSGRRLGGTTAAMGAIAVALALLTPSLPEMAGSVLAAQRTADTAGPETLLLAAAGLLAWAVWGWGVLGLLLTAGSALPGALGAAADLLVRAVLPGAARRSAALALGVGLGVTGPLAGATLLVATAPVASADAGPPTVPDWPVTGTGTGTGALPDWPSGAEPAPAGGVPAVPAAPAPGDHVVVRGDCLWHIAAAELEQRLGRVPTGGEVARATHAWWTANATVIGPDPDLLLPGQVLRPPPP